MSARDNGGPAFPTKRLLERDVDGMPLRDYFAAHATPPLALSRAWGEVMVGPYPKSEDGMTDAPYGRAVIDWWQAVDAAWRYAQADAMLKARSA